MRPRADRRLLMSLDQLVLDLRGFDVLPDEELAPSVTAARLAPLLRGDVVPVLRRLEIRELPTPCVVAILEALAARPWTAQLAELSLGSTPRPVASLAPRFGRAFAHLQAVALPPDLT